MTHISMKYGFFLALAGVILCGGCQSDPVPSGSEGSVTKLTLNAGLPEAEATKTVLGVLLYAVLPVLIVGAGILVFIMRRRR